MKQYLCVAVALAALGCEASTLDTGRIPQASTMRSLESILGQPKPEPSNGEPRLKPADPNVSGGYNKMLAKQIINRHKSEVLSCYATELQKNPALEGRIVIRWQIGLGQPPVKSVEVTDNTMGSDAVADCLVERSMAWDFVPPKRNVAISYPFSFYK